MVFIGWGLIGSIVITALMLCAAFTADAVNLIEEVPAVTTLPVATPDAVKVIEDAPAARVDFDAPLAAKVIEDEPA
ncbi:hypothetical protein, partial [Staphylococcus aureus]|uniref:hypothetical protein n=1 Tax=Staphylococcus aureus TaxID=1280 RepID=UPI0039BE5694